jgi:hypothetical protein
MRSKVLKAWLKCQVEDGRTRYDAVVMAKDVAGNVVQHVVPKEKIHPTRKAVAVVVFRDKDGFWVRFPSNSAYKPFRVDKKQLRKRI